MLSGPDSVRSARVDRTEAVILTGVLDLDFFPHDAGDLACRFACGRGHEDLVALRGVLAELAREVYFVAVNVLVADLQHAAEADADAQDNLLLGRPSRVDAVAEAFHRDRALDGAPRLFEQ